jgi:hypothetical protein
LDEPYRELTVVPPPSLRHRKLECVDGLEAFTRDNKSISRAGEYIRKAEEAEAKAKAANK